ncbi:hypothetical protein [Pontibacillus sp. HMF3514]|uniref:beta strand repeat-containing protein n=1 Tax=Pontibacillus sp. HMF3514 TaxID=2692425 RepID=UPI00131F7FEF|nr:hypothetical protein [Pontibacillus sp. HMF3514]QHE53750.1 hypothetical protein GS400_17765 [Pontibacillus sp. HMF3514]
MKSPFKVMSTAALAAAVAVPAVAAPTAQAAEATTIHSVAIQTEDGSVVTVPFMDYAKAMTFGTGELGEFVQANSVVAVSVEEGKFVTIKELAFAKLDNPDTATPELLNELDDNEENLVSDEEVAEYTAWENMGEDAAPMVESVSAIDAKTLEVDFNQAIDTENVDVKVKRGNFSVILDSEWNDDKDALTLSSETNLVAGDYTVTVTGEDLEEDLVGTVTVESQKVSDIEFLGETLVKTASDKATMNFKVFDQYGTDITTDADSLVNNISWSASVATDSLTDSNGVLTLDASSDFSADQTVVLTAVDSKTGESETVTATVGDAASVTALELGDVVLPEDTNRVYTGDADAAKIELNAQDQYGNSLSSSSQISGVTLLSSDSSVNFSIVDVDGEAMIDVDTSSLSTAKTVKLTAVINATGETVTKELNIVKPAEADEVRLGELETNVIAKGDAAGSVVVPVTVLNQFDEELTAAQIAAQAGNINVTGTGALNGVSFAINTDDTSDNYGKIVNTTSLTTSGAASIVVTSGTGETDSLTTEVKAERVVSDVVVPEEYTSKLISGADTQVSFAFQDQYGDAITPVAGNTNTNLTWEYTVSGDTEAVNVNKTSGTAEENMSPLTVSAVEGKTGEVAVTGKLLNGSNEVVSQATLDFSVVANNATGLTYSVDDVGTLAGDQDYGQAGADAYAKVLNVTATDEEDNSYAIPSSAIFKVTSSNSDLVEVSSGRLGDVAIDAQDNQWVIASGPNNGGATAATDVTVTVYVNTDDGVKTIEKTVTWSPAAPETTEVMLTDAAVTASNPYGLAAGTNEVSSLTFADRTAVDTGSALHVVTKDQYGVYSNKSTDSLFEVADSSKVDTTNSVAYSSTDGFVFDAASDLFELDEVTAENVQYRADSPITFVLEDNGQFAELDVTITAEEALDVASVGGTYTAGSSATEVEASETVVITFNDELSASSVNATIAELETIFANSLDGDGTGSVAKTSAAGADTEITVTADGGSITGGDDVSTPYTISAGTLVDLAGNKNDAAVNID